MTDKKGVDLVLRNGRFYTADRNQPWVRAVAVKAGRIVALDADAENRAAEKAIDLFGRMAMPGVIDVHTHMMMGGQSELFELRFPSHSSIAEICASVRDRAEETAAGAWIVGAQWGSDLLPRLNTEEALAALDEASLGHPVLLRDDTHHNRWCSS